ncbi:MAG: hypothetical protein WBG50_07095 [Desulfomonilaceae bacterium]
MKAFLWSAVIAFWMLCPNASFAKDFLGAPCMPGGKVVSQTDGRLKETCDVSYLAALKFFQEALKGEKDIQFRDRGTQILIEDHSNRPWHSITITKVAEDRTDIIYLKDNWTWILGTLTLRFFGVFAVLLVLYIALAISGAIISRLLPAQEQRS